MGTYKVFDGTNWIDICECNVHMKTLTNWQLLDPNNCPLKYWDGNQWCEVTCGGIAITNKTEINIWFDNSGSMNSTLAPLQTMQSTLLQACLLPTYNNDVVLYNERVKVLDMFSSSWNYFERFVKCLATEKNFNRATDASVNQVINLTFADESNAYGYGQSEPFDNSTRTSQYDADILTLRTTLTSAGYTIKGSAFRVNTGPNQYPGFRGLTEATFVNTGVYSPPNNISDFLGINFTYQLDTVAGSTPAYYLSQIALALNSLGINITC